MAKKFISANITEANAALVAAHNAINAKLTEAKIEQLPLNGVPTAINSTDIPLDQKIAAYAATVVPGAADAEMAALIASNDRLAAENKQLETRIATSDASLTAAQVENEKLKGQVTVLDKSCKELTAENASLRHRIETAQTETGRVTAENNALNNRISKECIAMNCITDFRDKDGNILPSTATAAEKEAAADLIKPADKLTLMKGAVANIVSSIGVPLTNLPSTNAAPPAAAKPGFNADGTKKTVDQLSAEHRAKQRK